MILTDIDQRQNAYDNGQRAQHYNMAYKRMVCKNEGVSIDKKFTDEYYFSMVDFLEAFDMARTMGQGARNLGKPSSYICRLKSAIECVQDNLVAISKIAPADFSMDNEDQRKLVKICYSSLAKKSPTGLDARNLTGPRNRTFAYDVGATKILHAMLPHHFIILDRIVAFALMAEYPNYDWHYRRRFPIGHSIDKYIMALRIAHSEVLSTLVLKHNTWSLDPATIHYRLFDKCAFAIGASSLQLTD